MRSFFTITFWVVLLTSIYKVSPAQHLNYNWSKTFGNGWGDYDNVTAVCYDKFENLYIAGNLRGARDFDPSQKKNLLANTNIWGDNLFIAKYSAKNELLWVHVFESQEKSRNNPHSLHAIEHIAIDSSNNLIICGKYEEQIDLDPSFDTTYIYGEINSSHNGFVAKYNPKGQYLWSINLGGRSSSARYFQIDQFNNITICGEYRDTIDFDPSAAVERHISKKGYNAFIAKYNSSGQLKWAKSIGVINQVSNLKLEVDTINDIILTGNFQDKCDFDPGPNNQTLTSKGYYTNAFFAKYDSLGNYKWAKQLESKGNVTINSIATNGKREIIIQGTFNNEVDFKTDKYEYKITPNGAEIFLAKYNKQGNLVWVNSYQNGTSLHQTIMHKKANGNLLLSGNFVGTINLGTVANPHFVYDSLGQNYLASIDPSGKTKWAKNLPSKHFKHYGFHIKNDSVALIYGGFNESLVLNKNSGFSNIYSDSTRGNKQFFLSINIKTNQYKSIFVLEPSQGGDDQIFDLAQDRNGDIVIIGTYSGRLDRKQFNIKHNDSSSEDNTTLIAKFDALGRNIFAFSLQLNNVWGPNEVITDSYNNIYITGGFTDSFDCDPSKGIHYLKSTYKWGIYLLKFDPNGNFLWAREFGGPRGIHQGGISIDSSDCIWLTGGFNEQIDMNPITGKSIYNTKNVGIYLMKYDPNGDFILGNYMPSNGYNYGTGLVTGKDNCLYITGQFTDSCDFDPSANKHVIKTSGYYTIFIAKYDSLGGLIWCHSLKNGKGQNYPNDLEIDENENLYLAGGFRDSTDFDPSSNNYYLYSNNDWFYDDDAFIASYKSNGKLRWANAYGSKEQHVDRFYSLSIFKNKVTALGVFQGNLSINQPNKDTSLFGENIYSPFLIILDTNNTFIESASLNANYGVSTGLATTQNSTYVAGRFNGIANLDPSKSIKGIHRSNGGSDMYVAKFTSTCLGTSSKVNLSACDTIISPSGFYTYKASGQYFDTIPNHAGCDSIIKIEAHIGKSYSNINLSNCRSFVSPSGKYIYNKSGTYIDTIANSEGCDSIITIGLEILKPSFSNIQITGCDKYTSPSGSFTFTNSGIYKDTITNSKGCDSIIMIDLNIIDNSPTISFSNNALSVDHDSLTYQWLNCEDEFAKIDTATSQKFKPTKSGEYTAVVYDKGCADTAACLGVVIVGNEEIENNGISVYPNPANDVLFVSSKFKVQSLKVFSLEGKVLIEAVDVNQVNIESLAASIYFIEVETRDGIDRFRFVKE
jgi:hypothetical protein